MKHHVLVSVLLSVLSLPMLGAAENSGSANLFFDFRNGTQTRPVWVSAINHEGGQVNSNRGWFVESNAPAASGKIVVDLVRSSVTANLALGIVFDELPDTDIAVQLWDDQNRVVAVDLFYNLLFKTKEAQTDTFVVPLQKYPHATKVVVRRVSGPVSIFALSLYPVAADAAIDAGSQEQLARFFGDPLSPSNSLHDAMALTKARETAVTKLISAPIVASSGTNNPGLIVGPLDGDRVPRSFEVRGRTAQPAAGHHLWVFVQVGRFLFPKAEATVDGHAWRATITEDGSPPGGKFFLALYDVGAEAHSRITEYKRKARASGSSPAWTDVTGASRVARVSLRLQPD